MIKCEHNLIVLYLKIKDLCLNVRGVEKAVIVLVFKIEDNRIYENLRGISLLTVAGKVFTVVILVRLAKHRYAKLSESETEVWKERACLRSDICT